jgi:hypothetical protein
MHTHHSPNHPPSHIAYFYFVKRNICSIDSGNFLEALRPGTSSRLAPLVVPPKEQETRAERTETGRRRSSSSGNLRSSSSGNLSQANGHTENNESGSTNGENTQKRRSKV